eukprot:5500287-Prorocentrum_lima.AAC.1
MTSSLVGSEMCIRDRLRSGPGSSTCRRHPVPSKRWRAPYGRRTVLRCGSVSYTHLTLPTICSV